MYQAVHQFLPDFRDAVDSRRSGAVGTVTADTTATLTCFITHICMTSFIAFLTTQLTVDLGLTVPNGT